MRRVSVIVGLVALMIGPPQAHATTIKLLCKFTWVTCVGVERLCGEHGEGIVTFDTAKNLVDGHPAQIGEDSISWREHVAGGSDNHISISRKTGDYSHHWEGANATSADMEGTCEVAPANKF